MHFARLLRGAGLRLGPDRVVDCVRALELADCNRREDWYWTMSAVFLSKEEQRPIFDQAFRIFWRDPKLVEKMMNALLPKTYGRAGKPEQEQSQRLSDAPVGQHRMREFQARVFAVGGLPSRIGEVDHDAFDIGSPIQIDPANPFGFKPSKVSLADLKVPRVVDDAFAQHCICGGSGIATALKGHLLEH